MEKCFLCLSIVPDGLFHYYLDFVDSQTGSEQALHLNTFIEYARTLISELFYSSSPYTYEDFPMGMAPISLYSGVRPVAIISIKERLWLSSHMSVTSLDKGLDFILSRYRL